MAEDIRIRCRTNEHVMNLKLKQAEKLTLELFLSATTTLLVATSIVAAWINTLKGRVSAVGCDPQAGHPTSRRISPTFLKLSPCRPAPLCALITFLDFFVFDVAVAVLIPHPHLGRVPSPSQHRGLLPFNHDRRFVFIHSFGDSAIQLSNNCLVEPASQIHRPTRK